MKKKTARVTPARRPRRLAERQIIIASRDTLPDKRYNTLSGGWQQTSATDSDVKLYEPAPGGFQVSAMLRGDVSYLWIGIQGAAPGAALPYAIVGGDTLRKLVTEYLKHFNAPQFAAGGAR